MLVQTLHYLGYSSAHANISSPGYTFLGGWAKNPIIRPFGKDFVDGRVVNGGFPSGVCWHGQALPLHPGIEDPQDEVKDAIIAQFALWTALRH